MKEYLIVITSFVGVAILSFFFVGFIASRDFEKPSLKDFKSFPRAYVVESGSMEPGIKVGSIVFVKPESDYKKGQVITFKQGSSIITHRIAMKSYPSNVATPMYSTKGDANNTVDSEAISKEKVIGRVFFFVPYLGRIVDFAKKPYGFILLVIIPGTIFIYEEIKSLLSEALKSIRAYKAKRKEEDKSRNGKSLPKLTMAIPFFGAFFVFLGLTGSFFTNQGGSNGNVFSAMTTFPVSPPIPPTTNHLVINEVVFNPINSSACGPSENDAEWVEIFNPTSSSVNLDLWSVGDSNSTDDLPNISIPAGGFAIVSDCSQSSFNSIWPIPVGTVYIDISGAIGNGLNNGGEQMRLLNGVTLTDSVSYGSNTDAFNPSVSAPVGGHSMERNPDGVDTDTKNDFVDRTTPQPGQ